MEAVEPGQSGTPLTVRQFRCEHGRPGGREAMRSPMKGPLGRSIWQPRGWGSPVAVPCAARSGSTVGAMRLAQKAEAARSRERPARSSRTLRARPSRGLPKIDRAAMRRLSQPWPPARSRPAWQRARRWVQTVRTDGQTEAGLFLAALAPPSPFRAPGDSKKAHSAPRHGLMSR